MTQPDGEFPDLAANYASLATWAATTQSDWEAFMRNPVEFAFTRILDGLFEGLQTGISFALALLSGIAKAILNLDPTTFFATVEDALDALGPLGAAVSDGVAAFAAFLSAVGESTMGAAGELLATVATVITQISDIFAGLTVTPVNTAVQQVKDWWVATGADLPAAITNAGNAVGSLATLVSNAGAGTIGALGTLIANLSTMLSQISDIFHGASVTPINTVVQQIKDWWTATGTNLPTAISNAGSALTQIGSAIAGAGAANAGALGAAVATAGTNIGQIGQAAQNAAAGIVGSLNTAATQVQTAFSGILNSLFGGFTGTPAPANQTQAQVTAAAQNVATNFVGNAATFVGIQNAEAAAANLMSVKFNFADYGTGTVALPSSFTVSNDPTYTNNGGGIQIVDGRATYQATGVGSAHKLARYNAAPTTTDYMEVSWVHTGDQDGAGGSGHSIVYARMNSAATSFLQFITLNGNTLAVNAVVAGAVTGITSYTNMKPGARYVIKCGDLSNNRKIYLYENDALVLSFTDAVHQVGASYRYAAFGVSGNNTGTQLRNFAFNVFGVADQVFKPGPAATAYVSASETRALTTYGDLATTSDQVTVTVGSSGMVELCLSSFMSLSGSAGMWATFEASGANTIAASDIYAVEYTSPGAGYEDRKGATYVIGGLNPGVTTFKMKYRVNAGTGTWKDRPHRGDSPLRQRNSMTVISVTRIDPATYVGIEVNATSLADIISLGRALKEFNYRFELDCAAEFDGIGRLTIRRADFGDQHAYDGDWLKVSNASFVKDESTGLVKEWSVSATTSITLYGGGPAQPFSVEDFAATFTEVVREPERRPEQHEGA